MNHAILRRMLVTFAATLLFQAGPGSMEASAADAPAKDRDRKTPDVSTTKLKPSVFPNLLDEPRVPPKFKAPPPPPEDKEVPPAIVGKELTPEPVATK